MTDPLECPCGGRLLLRGKPQRRVRGNMTGDHLGSERSTWSALYRCDRCRAQKRLAAPSFDVPATVQTPVPETANPDHGGIKSRENARRSDDAPSKRRTPFPPEFKPATFGTYWMPYGGEGGFSLTFTEEDGEERRLSFKTPIDNLKWFAKMLREDVFPAADSTPRSSLEPN